MTVPVPDQLEYITDADGVTKEFPYPKRFLQKDEIVVLLRDADDVETPQYLNTHYTIAGSSWPSGGAILFNAAPASGLKVVRYRMTQAKQTVDLENRQRNDAPSVELQLDRLTMAVQDRGSLLSRAVQTLFSMVFGLKQEIIDRINGDKALASLIGQFGSIEVPFFDTRVAVSLATIKPTINSIRVGGDASVGDGIDKLYKRVGSEPPHSGKVQSHDGAWWEEVKSDGSRTFWQTRKIPYTQSVLTTTGYYQEGDGGGALYKRVATEPSHNLKLQTADGAWWEHSGTDIDVRQVGVFPNTGVSVLTPLNHALEYLRIKGGGVLRNRVLGEYQLPDNLIMGSNCALISERGVKYLRTGNGLTMIVAYSDGTVGGYGALSNWVVDGGTWDNNRDNFAGAASCIAFSHASNVIVRNTNILNVSYRYHAIECNASNNVLIEGNYFDRGGEDSELGECIQIDGAHSGGSFPWYGPEDNTCCTNVTIRDNKVVNWAVCIGTHSTYLTNRHVDIKIYNNSFSFSRRGISMMSWAGVHIENNRFSGTDAGATGWMYGIYAAYAGGDLADIVIKGNSFLGINRDSGMTQGSRAIHVSGSATVTSGSRNLRIIDNFIDGVGRHAIAIENTTGFLVANNTILAAGGRAIYSYGNVRGQIEGNRIDSAHTDEAISVVAVGSYGGTFHQVVNNMVTGSNGGIGVNVPWVTIVNNFAPALNKTGATGILGPNWIAGALVS